MDPHRRKIKGKNYGRLDVTNVEQKHRLNWIENLWT